MNNIDALVNLILLGIILFRSDRLVTAMRFECIWISIQFIWIACRPRMVCRFCHHCRRLVITKGYFSKEYSLVSLLADSSYQLQLYVS